MALRRQVVDTSDGLGLIAALREDRSRLVEFEDKLPPKLKASVEGPAFTRHCGEWFTELDADKNGVLRCAVSSYWARSRSTRHPSPLQPRRHPDPPHLVHHHTLSVRTSSPQ